MDRAASGAGVLAAPNSSLAGVGGLAAFFFFLGGFLAAFVALPDDFLRAASC